MESAVTAAFSRRELIRVPGISGASVSRRGPRSLNADAAASWTDRAAARTAFVVADGIGDHLPAARAARLVAATAARAGAHFGAKAGILAAQEELLRQLPEREADSVLVVAVGSTLGGRWDIAWVGDCRAYRWNGRVLHQITTDHTVAEYFRALGRPAAPRMSHLVTTSARTTSAADIGQAETGASEGRLLLSTDGVHKSLGMSAIKELLARTATPGVAADALVEGARSAGSTDNATALVVDCF